MCKFCEARKEGTVCEIESNKLLQAGQIKDFNDRIALKAHLKDLQINQTTISKLAQHLK